MLTTLGGEFNRCFIRYRLTTIARFAFFGLDLFVAAFKRGRFDLHDADVLSRLEPMVNVAGSTLYAPNGNVISSGLKAIA